mmetsp:Transcript_7732/g.11479  ORF Transcript_7732/g.11479 Transcript_7732/m.11479 type:complete len:1173 (+) Transcript_7732:111-3629(+)
MGGEDRKSRKRHRSYSRSRSRSRSADRDKRGRHKDKKRDRETSQERDKRERKSSRREREKDIRIVNRGRDDRGDSKGKSRNRSHRGDDRRRDDKNGSSGRGEDAVARVAALISQRALGAEKTAEERDKERKMQIEAEQELLEVEMRKRRERVKAWQEEKARRLAATGAGDGVADAAEGPSSDGGGETESKEPGNSQGGRANWSLEDEDDDDDDDENDVVERKIEVDEPNLPAIAERGKSEVDEQQSTWFDPSAITPQMNSHSDNNLKATSVEPKNSSTPSTEDGTGVDPLDAFMSSLYDTGDVAEQDAAVAEPAGLGSGKSGSVNPFGSNFITLEQLVGSGNRRGEADEDGRNEWESDVAMSPAPSVAALDDGAVNEEEEERERREFIEALRNAHVETTDSKEIQKDDQPAGAGDDGSGSLGRVFAGEGDVIDESEVEAKKKSALELLEEAKRGKELRPVDHSTIEYLPFRKNLYIVPRALARMLPEEVVLERQALQIKVRGKGCPAPVSNWDQCGLSERILAVINKNGFEAPFAIQKQAIPAIMCGRDIIGVAKTGSGKTLAFLLPMFRHILDQPPLRESEGPIGLIMAPARELAFQIFNEAKKFTKALGMRVACVYGGAGVADQIAELKRGADIVVCTPGRMIDILCMQAGKLVTLKRVTMVVMDEADRMFDMGFEPQIKMILQNVRPDRQTVLFSATFPKQIEKLAKSILRFPLEIVVGERSAANKDITQYVEVHEEEEKFMRLLQLLGIWYERGSVLIFVDKQEKCDQLFQDLLKSGYPCLSLHGGKDQLDRDHTLHEFKTLVKTVMVATSVAGRGLDVPEIVCVINYNCPNHVEDYVHRVGRTGRAGRKGTAYTFISPTEDQYAPIMKTVLEKAGQPVPDEIEELAASFKEKVARGEAHWSNSGFYGKGYTFDASEMNEAQKLASMQRRAYEIEQGIISEKGDEDEMGEPPEDMFGYYEEDEGEEASSDGAVEATSTVAVEPAPTASSSAAVPSVSASSSDMTPLERARALAMALNANKTTTATTTTPALPPAPVTADGKIDTKAAMNRAKMIAMQMGGGKSGDGEMHYMEELEINDYPPQARKKVTQRQTLDDVTERTGVAIISRGSYVPPGKKLEIGERKLFLLIEGPTEMQVKQARLDMQRMLEEETIRLGASGQTSFGRYSVL